MNNTKSQRSKQLSRQYFNISQCRLDIWSKLKDFGQLLTKAEEAQLPAYKKEVKTLLRHLDTVERYWTYPGRRRLRQIRELFLHQEYAAFLRTIEKITRNLASDRYRYECILDQKNSDSVSLDEKLTDQWYYYEVLMVDNLGTEEEHDLKQKFAKVRQQRDQFYDKLLVVKSFQDALIAVLFNYHIQACVLRYHLPFQSTNDLGFLKPFVTNVLKISEQELAEGNLSLLLARKLKAFRPELDLYYVTDKSIDQTTDEELSIFRRIFYRREDLQELHLSIKHGIRNRFRTPFFTALQAYSQRPTGVFHAMPISRGNSVFKSHWVQDFGHFYGRNLFLAETSATTGGLDSLLQPTGPLKEAQEMAANAFGAERTFFVTNGTSTSNKIVSQALLQPGDIVLVDRDCHKSHHYSMMLSGAHAVYLDSYPVPEYAMYGAVPLETICAHLRELKQEGRLDKVKMLILTNCTFDGIVYHPEKVMEAVLAIKPDMVFLWDEAWFGFAAFTKTYRSRTGMHAARKLARKYKSEAYREAYRAHKQQRGKANGQDAAPMPDPDKVRLRVYATQSTHKTLTSLRQGSMIHVYDEEFERRASDAFHEAYMTHISTSANYQILASLDAGRRQTMFEGFGMVERSVEMAMVLREKIANHPLLQKYFRVLQIRDFIPGAYRRSSLEQYYDPSTGWSSMGDAWSTDEFVLDPTKVTLHIGNTGVDGDTFKNRYLMEQFQIQINKTSRNSVLFMTNIGTTRSSVAFLIRALHKIATDLEQQRKSLNPAELQAWQARTHKLTESHTPLPDFSAFHQAFRPYPNSPEGDLRAAFFLAYDDTTFDYLSLKECLQRIEGGEEVVSAVFIIPYPPGFPILVPGQVASREILTYMMELDVQEIHGYRPQLGLKVFKPSVLAKGQHQPRKPGAQEKAKKAASNSQRKPASKQAKHS